MHSKTALTYALSVILGVAIGASAAGDIAVAVAGCIMLFGLSAAFILNWVYIAPRAGEIAKQRVIDMFTSDDKQDQQLLQLASVNIIGNISALCQHEEGMKLVKPIFRGAFETFNESLDMSLKNLHGQAVRGAGVYADQEVDMKQILAEGVFPVITSAVEGAGGSERLAQMINAKIAGSVFKAANDGGSLSPNSGYVPSGGK